METVVVAKILKFGGQRCFETAAQISEEGCILAGGAPVSELGGKARGLGLRSLRSLLVGRAGVSRVRGTLWLLLQVWANWIKLLLG